MCGIVCFYGQYGGVVSVLEALSLLEYRAPDSSGVGVVDRNGKIAARRVVGSPRNLVRELSTRPFYNHDGYQRDHEIEPQQVYQQINGFSGAIRDLCNQPIRMLYHPDGVRVGIGDKGCQKLQAKKIDDYQFSKGLRQTVLESGATPSLVDSEIVRHAFRLLSANMVSRTTLNRELQSRLDQDLLDRIGEESFKSWREAFEIEAKLNVPGHAFEVAVRAFQEDFPGLAAFLEEKDWGRIGGLTAQAMAQVVMGHGRWAMVGAVSELNAHPITDRSETRAVVENGSHNASVMLQLLKDQETWWRINGLPPDEPVHRTENTTEVIAYEWERNTHLIEGGELDEGSRVFVNGLIDQGIFEVEEQAIRLTMHRITEGNTHACAFLSGHTPGVLYVSSHNKPIAIAIREVPEDWGLRYELMVASDVNAALMLWTGQEVEETAERINELKRSVEKSEISEEEGDRAIKLELQRFSLNVFFLDNNLYGGKELFARIENRLTDGKVTPEVVISRYDGSPVTTIPQKILLNPSMVGKRGFQTYTESHIDEIPDVFDDILRTYVLNHRVQLDSVWRDGALMGLGLNVQYLQRRFGDHLENLCRLLLIGEGSSWRDANAAAPLFRELLPHVVVNIYRPVEVLNLGESVEPNQDLAIEISWSGTTDSLLKVDSWLSEFDVMRLGITGRPQSDLGRRTAKSAGTIDVHSGIEVSVATVKGYHAILVTLDLLALQMAEMVDDSAISEELVQLTNELEFVIPGHVRAIVTDQNRRDQIKIMAEGMRQFNKVAVLGSSPVDMEAELKIEELAQIVAINLDFQATTLRNLIERSALMQDDRQRTLFIVNATTPNTVQEARPIISYLKVLGLSFLVHTIPNEYLNEWQKIPGAKVFLSPQVSERYQPLIDAPFYFDLAVALAFARGLTPDEIDRPRNLAKSVTTTGAERRQDLVGRQVFKNISFERFNQGGKARSAWNSRREKPSLAALRETVALRGALSVLSESTPKQLDLERISHLIVLTDTEATENAANMARTAWEDQLQVDVAVYRRFINDLPIIERDTGQLRLIRSGSVLSLKGTNTIALPSDLTPFQLEMLSAVYLIGLAIRLARQGGTDTSLWEAGLAQMPFVLTEVLNNRALREHIRKDLSPFVEKGYDKVQVIGGGQDFAAAESIARSIRARGFMAEALYTDSAWHGPLATVGGQDADHDALIFILATDPLFQFASLVDTQVYRTRFASVLLVVPEGNEDLPAVERVYPTGVISVPAVPRPLISLVNAAMGEILAKELAILWDDSTKNQNERD